jgi:hypothetical protein
VNSGKPIKPYSGRLVLKPLPHKNEDDYSLTAAEEKRFVEREESEAEFEEVDRAEYFDFQAEDGLLVVFPSWLHHAVLPFWDNGAGHRISIAVNFNQKSR